MRSILRGALAGVVFVLSVPAHGTGDRLSSCTTGWLSPYVDGSVVTAFLEGSRASGSMRHWEQFQELHNVFGSLENGRFLLPGVNRQHTTCTESRFEYGFDGAEIYWMEYGAVGKNPVRVVVCAEPVFAVTLRIAETVREVEATLRAVEELVDEMESDMGLTLDIELDRAEMAFATVPGIAAFEFAIGTREKSAASGREVRWPKTDASGKYGFGLDEYRRGGGMDAFGGRVSAVFSMPDAAATGLGFRRVLGFMDKLAAHGTVALTFEGWRNTVEATDGIWGGWPQASWYEMYIQSQSNSATIYTLELSGRGFEQRIPSDGRLHEAARPASDELPVAVRIGATRSPVSIASGRGAVNDALGFVHLALAAVAFPQASDVTKVTMTRVDDDGTGQEEQARRGAGAPLTLPGQVQPLKSLVESFSFEVIASGKLEVGGTTEPVLSELDRVVRAFEEAGLAAPEIESFAVKQDGAWRLALSASGCGRDLEVTSKLLARLREMNVRVKGKYTTRDFRLLVDI